MNSELLHKISKYEQKFNGARDVEHRNIYRTKLNYYRAQIHQFGGAILSADALAARMAEIARVVNKVVEMGAKNADVQANIGKINDQLAALKGKGDKIRDLKQKLAAAGDHEATAAALALQIADIKNRLKEAEAKHTGDAAALRLQLKDAQNALIKEQNEHNNTKGERDDAKGERDDAKDAHKREEDAHQGTKDGKAVSDATKAALLAELETKLAEANAALQEALTARSQAVNDLDVCTRKMGEGSDAAKALKQELDEVSKRLQAKSDEVVALNGTVAKRDARITDLEGGTITEDQREKLAAYDELRKELDELVGELAEESARTDALLASRNKLMHGGVQPIAPTLAPTLAPLSVTTAQTAGVDDIINNMYY
jgi:chromosome segregation ATPase